MLWMVSVFPEDSAFPMPCCTPVGSATAALMFPGVSLRAQRWLLPLSILISSQVMAAPPSRLFLALLSSLNFLT